MWKKKKKEIKLSNDLPYFFHIKSKILSGISRKQDYEF